MTMQAIKRLAKPGTTLEERAEAVLSARAEAERVGTMLAMVEGAFKDEARARGVRSVVTTDGTKVTAVLDAQRRAGDIDTLRTLVSPEVFTQATKPAMDWEGWDALVKVGMVPEDVQKTVVTVTLFDQVRVTR